jgi:hypothetical protein
MTLLITSIVALIAGGLFGKCVAKAIIWYVERNWGKHYRIKFKDYNDKPAVIHIWTKDDLAATYALMIREAHKMIKEGVEEKPTKFDRVGGSE